MSQHMWQPLGMTSTTFRIVVRPDLIARLCGTTTRKLTGELVPDPAPLPVTNP